MQKLQYLNDDPNQGIIYDWGHIKKEYRKLHCPKGVYDPLQCDFGSAGYCMSLSDRSQGKTTNPLLVSMIMHRDYGTTPHYIRCTRNEVEVKILKDLFKTILDFDYISKIWDGRWTSVYYYGKRWYLCNRDDDGQIIERNPDSVLTCFCLDESDELKSSYNAPRGDIVIFDEFIETVYGYGDYVRFMDILKTIFRDRLTPVVYMLSNTINVNSPWFDEFCIRDDINSMDIGEKRYIQTPLGPTIYVDLMLPKQDQQRKQSNKRFFAFKNPKLSAITGVGGWATHDYPHIPSYKDVQPEVLHQKVYISQSNRLIHLQLINSPAVGLCVYASPATRTYTDSVIMTHGDIVDRQHVFCFGSRDQKLLQLYWRLYQANLWYYANNNIGALVSAYMQQAKDAVKLQS